MLSVIVPVLVTVILGIICREAHILSPEQSAAAKKIALNITLPAVSLAAYLDVDYSLKSMLVPLWIFTALCLMLASGFAVKKLLRSRNDMLPFLCTGFEGGMLGFALYPLLHENMGPFSLIIMGNVFFVFTVYKVLVSGVKGKAAILREAAASPSLWALFLGIVLNVSGLYAAMEPSGIQAVFRDTLTFVSKSTSFLVLLTIGYDLDFRRIRWKDSFSAFFCREIICVCFLAVTLLLNRYALGGMMKTDAAVLAFMLPAPYVINIFAPKTDDSGIISSALTLQTCFTLIIFFALSALNR